MKGASKIMGLWKDPKTYVNICTYLVGIKHYPGSLCHVPFGPAWSTWRVAGSDSLVCVCKCIRAVPLEQAIGRGEDRESWKLEPDVSLFLVDGLVCGTCLAYARVWSRRIYVPFMRGTLETTLLARWTRLPRARAGWLVCKGTCL